MRCAVPAFLKLKDYWKIQGKIERVYHAMRKTTQLKYTEWDCIEG
jgi:hypothetical protein